MNKPTNEPIQPMPIQLWCSNAHESTLYEVRAPWSACSPNGEREYKSGVCLWLLLLLPLLSFHSIFPARFYGMENKISHFGCFMWMYVSLCLLFSREKKELFRLFVALAFLLFWHCCVPRAVTKCTKTSGKERAQTECQTIVSWANGFCDSSSTKAHVPRAWNNSIVVKSVGLNRAAFQRMVEARNNKFSSIESIYSVTHTHTHTHTTRHKCQIEWNKKAEKKEIGLRCDDADNRGKTKNE